MTAFWRRRVVSLALLLLAGSLLYLAERIYEISLRDGTYLTGWILFVMTVLLALLNVRKKLSVLPLLPAAFWFQTHVYVGILAFGLFFLHSNFRLPNGPFEKALWWASVLAFATGILGMLLSRVLPGRLKRHPERIVFERIPAFRSELQQEAECLALRAVGNSDDSRISDFYLKVLAPFLRKPTCWGRDGMPGAWTPSSGPCGTAPSRTPTACCRSCRRSPRRRTSSTTSTPFRSRSRPGSSSTSP